MKKHMIKLFHNVESIVFLLKLKKLEDLFLLIRSDLMAENLMKSDL